jgi:hypothetical protein
MNTVAFFVLLAVALLPLVLLWILVRPPKGK